MPDAGGRTSISASEKTSRKETRLLEDSFDIVPSGLTFCFDRGWFLNDDFQSESFIFEQQRRGVSLEDTRDGLLQYSNILRSALVELINRDYAEFVNLSTNLVGLDKAIDVIASPLTSLKLAVNDVMAELDHVGTDLTSKLRERQQLRDVKASLNALSTMNECVVRLEGWLATPGIEEDSALDSQPLRAGENKITNSCIDLVLEDGATNSFQEGSSQRLDRVANEFAKLQFFAKKCAGHPILLSIEPRICRITSTLLEQLEIQLKEAIIACHLNGEATERSTALTSLAGKRLRKAISSYLAIDRRSDLLLHYGRHTVKEKLAKIFLSPPPVALISNSAESGEAAKVMDGLYDSALQVLDHQLETLQKLGSQLTVQSYDPLAEFNCLIHVFWPELVDVMCTNLSGMFAPGNPDKFYALYTSSKQFIQKLERRLQSTAQILEFRNHPAYTEFMNNWGILVYFQIRFQKIAGVFEEAVSNGLVLATEPKHGCHLHVTEVLITQLLHCWEDGIYLVDLRHRFWRLTLQLLSRYTTFVEEVMQQLGSDEPLSANHLNLRTANDFTEKLNVLMFLLVDCYRVSEYAKNRMFNVIVDVIGPLGSASDSQHETTSNNNLESLKDSLAESCCQLIQAVTPISTVLTAHVQQCSRTFCRQVADVPRHYRRTNRGLPTQASGYVAGLLQPLISVAKLASDNSQALPCIIELLRELVCNCATIVTKDYCENLTELLASVRKTEDSLKKLREARRGGANYSHATAYNATTSGTSDDDKIRHQLHLDGCVYRDSVTGLWGINATVLAQLEQVTQVTQNSKTE